MIIIKQNCGTRNNFFQPLECTSREEIRKWTMVYKKIVFD